MNPTSTAKPRALERVTEPPTWWRRIDVALLGAAPALALCGLLAIYSATRNTYGTSLVARQGVFVFVGLVLMATVAAIDYRRIASWSLGIYAAVSVVLIAVLTPLGSASKGAQAWFQVGGFQIQPSEYAKLGLILCLATYCARQRGTLEVRHVGVAAVIALVPMGLIGMQPDLGTALVFMAIVAGILLVAGAPAKAMVALVAVVVAAAVAAVSLGVLKQYQLDRLGAFLDPESNTQQSAYNLNQSKIAIGSGGVTGKGLFLGTQTNLRYVPEQHTDFIFTVIGEELGLVGSTTLVGLFALLVWRTWRAARLAADALGTLICAGVLAMFVFQIFENVGMTMGIMPITGIPLPFVSYGGSSILSCSLGIGLVLSVRFRSE